MVDNTDTKQQMLKEPFKFLQGKFSGWGCLETNLVEYVFICSQDIQKQHPFLLLQARKQSEIV